MKTIVEFEDKFIDLLEEAKKDGIHFREVYYIISMQLHAMASALLAQIKFEREG